MIESAKKANQIRKEAGIDAPGLDWPFCCLERVRVRCLAPRSEFRDSVLLWFQPANSDVDEDDLYLPVRQISFTDAKRRLSDIESNWFVVLMNATGVMLEIADGAAVKIEVALAVFTLYPQLVAVSERSKRSANLLHWLRNAHVAAADALVRESREFGVDAKPLFRSAAKCRRLFSANHTSRRTIPLNAEWPYCLPNIIRRKPREDDFELIDETRATIVELRAALQSQAREPRGSPAVPRQRANRETAQKSAAPRQRPAKIIHHGERSFSIGKLPPVDLTDTETAVLLVFMNHRTRQLAEIRRESHIDAPHRVLKALRTKYAGVFAKAIILPGGKGRGGYRIAVAGAPQKRQH